MNIAILHGYSAKNSGDGLLLQEAISLVRTNICSDACITVVASYPETFALDDVEFVRSRPSRFGFDRRYLAFLAHLRKFDLVIAVGGGYLRFKTRNESFKTAVVHLPQLAAAAMLAKRSVYLPQSVGPSPRFFRPIIRRLGSKVDAFYVRDDRSMSEFPGSGFQRMPDMALLASDKRQRAAGPVDSTPVYSIRPVGGHISPAMHRLATLLNPYVGYVQSTGAGNDDTDAMRQIGCTEYVSRSDLM
ncbi:MAG: polysaccharide pyruvyl transferase family protein, partial [Thermomicrobiales bacterium]